MGFESRRREMRSKRLEKERLLGQWARGAVALLTAVALGGGQQTARADDLSQGWEAAGFVSEFEDASRVQSSEGTTEKNVATVTRRSRAGDFHDFLRLIWVPPGLKITTLGKPRAKRAFFTASSFLNPPAPVDAVVHFVGNNYRTGQDLGVMVCRPLPSDLTRTDPILATWPKVLPVIKRELGDCAAGTLTRGEKELCAVAERYQDRRFLVYARGLKETLNLAVELFRTEARRNALWDDFSIGNAFSGLGFTIWGSSTPEASTKALYTAVVLQRSVVPEYLLRNVTLQEANCRCVQVPESEALHQELVDPSAIWAAGELDQGACRQLPALP